MKRLARRRWTVVITVVVLAVLAACGGGDETAAPVAGQGGARGFAFVPIGRQAVEVRLGRDATPPAGFEPLAGAGVAVGSVTVTTAANGSFTLTNIPVGQQTLVFTFEGQTVEIPITVIADATIEVGEPTIGKAAALQAIVDAAVAAGFAAEELLVAMPPTPLPAGVTIEPSLLTGEADPPPAEPVVTLAASSWFGFVDPFCTNLYGHDVLLVLVDDETGAVTSLPRQSWPTINGVEYYRDRDGFVESADAARLPTAEPGTFGAVDDASREALGSDLARARLVEGCASTRVFSMSIAGYSGEGIPESATLFADALSPIVDGASDSFFGPSANPVADIQTKLRALYAQMRPCDTFVLYICTHAATPNFYRMNLQTTTSITAIFPTQFLLNECPACHITVIQEVCFSGSNLTRTGTASNPTFKEIFASLPGKDCALLTAAGARQGSNSYGAGVIRSVLSTFSIVREAGGAFTRGLVGGLNDNTGSFDGNLFGLLGLAFQRALQDSKVGEQDPQFYLKPDDGQGCPGVTVQPPANQPPVAEAGPASVSSTSPATLDGSASTDPDGTISSFEWRDVADGSLVGTGAVITVERAPGTYTFELKVTDNRGAMSTDRITVTVTPPQPVRCAGVLFQNDGNRAETFRVVAANVTFDGQPVTLQPGQSFSAVTQVAIDNLNFVVFAEGQEFDQGFEIDVPCGQQQVFIFNGFGFEFDQRPLPPP